MLRAHRHHGHFAWGVLRGRDDEPSEHQGYVRIFDYARFAEPLRERIRTRVQEAFAEASVGIEHISNPHIRTEDVVAKGLARSGDHPGLVHGIAAMEADTLR